MGLKAGLQILQQTGKAVVNYTDNAARFIAKNENDAVGFFCRKAKPINPTELKDLRIASEAIGDTFEQTIKIKSPTNVRSYIVDNDTCDIFPFAKIRSIKTSDGQLQASGMILCHLSDFPPQQGFIDTARSAIGAARDSVHFAVNHAPTSHFAGCWDNKTYAILAPMESTLKIKSNTFFGGVPADFYSKGKIKLPQDAVVVKFNETIPQGKYRISDTSVIDEIKGSDKFILIETSEKNMKKAVDNIVQKLGYEFKDSTEAWYWGSETSVNRFEDFESFNKLLARFGMKTAFHTYTPNNKVDMLIEKIMERSYLEQPWNITKGNDVIFDAKKEALEILDYIKKYTDETNYDLDYDITKLKEIILTSDSPVKALDDIKNTFGITTPIALEKKKFDVLGVREYTAEQKENIIQYSILERIASTPIAKTEKALLKYILEPNQTNFNGIKNSYSLEDLLSDLTKVQFE